MTGIKINPAQTGFDFDGVIADIGEAFLRIACYQYEYCDIRIDDITHFHVEQCTDMNPQIVESIFTQILNDSVGSELKPMPGSIEVLKQMAEIAPVKIITARPIAAPVIHWFEQYMERDTVANIQLVAMGDHDDKARYIKELNLTHFIDDRAETCYQLQEAGIKSILFAQPWNRSHHADIPKVDSWDDIKNLW